MWGNGGQEEESEGRRERDEGHGRGGLVSEGDYWWATEDMSWI